MKPDKRLTHTSPAAYKRLMQMSSAKVFAFVEGWSDRYFYDKICKSSLGYYGIQYKLCLAQELPALTGGKAALLNFYNYLNRYSSLINDFKGKRTCTVFFLDKDIDDILKRAKTSAHLIYTQYYDIENHIFAQANFVEAIAAAASLDRESIRAVLNTDNDTWRSNVAETWRDWVKLCIFTKLRNLNHECNYGVYSRINKRPYTPVDSGLYVARMADLKMKSGLTTIGFRRVFERISREVDRIYDEDKQDLVFKGKWYIQFLAEDVKKMAAGRQFNSNNLQERLLSCLQMSLNFEDSWAEHFKRPLKNLLPSIC